MALGAFAFVFVVFAVFLLVLGACLTIGEWLLGSMGWGVDHGVLMFLAVAMAAVLAAIGVSGRRIGRSLFISLVVGVVLAIVLGLDGLNRLYAAIGDGAATNIEPGVRPLAIGIVLGALLGLVVGLATAARMHGSGGARTGAVVVAIVVGVAAGAFTSITFGARVGVGLGITAGLIMWMTLMGVDVARSGIDVQALKDRFTPVQTIETSKETLEWLQKRMPPGIGS